jgi:hypothetical protein
LTVAEGAATPRAVVIRSDSEEVTPVTGVHVSAAWKEGSIADDVAILRVAHLASDATPLPLADPSTIAALTRGMSLATFGFPVVSTGARRPRGRLAVDVLGDVRDGRYLAVGLRIAPGTSGSPIFLRDGVVVGIVAGGDFIVSPTSTGVSPSRRFSSCCGSAIRPRGELQGRRFCQNARTRSTDSPATRRAASVKRSAPKRGSALTVRDTGIGTSSFKRADSPTISIE